MKKQSQPANGRNSYQIKEESRNYKLLNSFNTPEQRYLQRQTIDMLEEEKRSAILRESAVIPASTYNLLLLQILENRELIDPNRTQNKSKDIANNKVFNAFFERSKNNLLQEFFHTKDGKGNGEVAIILKGLVSAIGKKSSLDESAIKVVVRDFCSKLPRLHNRILPSQKTTSPRATSLKRVDMSLGASQT